MVPKHPRDDNDEAGGEDVLVAWRGHRVKAFVPTRLTDRQLELPASTIRRTATAAAQVHLAAEHLTEDLEPLARLLLRAEGVASSFIEGVTASMAEIVVAEAGTGDFTPASWVAANLAAVSQAVESAHDDALSVERICSWHRALMAGSPMPSRYVGVLRDEQGWIGGTSPLDAALVTPPPDLVPALVDDLVAYANRDDVDPIAHAAIAHAQFEVIHPFGDGNGRVGRVLVSWLLTRNLHLVTPPPVSIRLAADRNGYLSGLALFRLGQHVPWIEWFADAVASAGRAQRQLLDEVAAIRRRWQSRLAESPHGSGAVHRDAVAWSVVDLLPRYMVLTSAIVAEHTGCQVRAARDALATLVAREILVEHVPQGRRTNGRPPKLYVSPELLGLAGSDLYRAPRRM